MNKKKLSNIIKKLHLYFGNPYDYRSDPPEILDVLIATKLSQSTTDKSSFKAYKNLKEKYIDWEEVSNAGLKDLKECIKVCGLSNTKAGNIKKMLLEMKRKYGNLDLTFLRKYSNEEIYKELLQYEGIGVKTISCVLIFALDRDAFPVDTHVHRILNRLGVVKTASAEKTFEKAIGLIPAGKKYELHTNLIKFGRNICRSKEPLCSVCFLYRECKFEEKSIFRKKARPDNITENNFIILENI